MTGRRLEVRTAALRDLVSIYRFSIERWGVERADRYVHDIDNAIESLRDGKLKGRRSRVGNLRKLRVASHHIVFHVKRSSLVIHRITHVAMDERKQLRRG